MYPYNKLGRPLVILLVIIYSNILHANISYLETLKANTQRYDIGANCEMFIKTTKREDLESTEIKKALITIENSKFSTYFFHYSDDKGNHLQTASESNNFKPIVEHGLNAENGLTQYYGPGFYLASNPFSSSGFGEILFILELDPRAKIFWDLGQENMKLLANVIDQKRKKLKYFADCPIQVAKNLILDSSDVDLVFYKSEDYFFQEWSLLLNEDIIKKSTSIKIGYTGNPSGYDWRYEYDKIVRKIVSANMAKSLLVHVEEYPSEAMYKKRNRHFVLSPEYFLKELDKSGDSEALTQLVKTTKNFKPSFKNPLAKKISEIDGEQFTTLINLVQEKEILSLADFDNLDIGSSSQDFIKLKLKEWHKAPQLTKNWSQKLILKNIKVLLRNESLHMDSFRPILSLHLKSFILGQTNNDKRDLELLQDLLTMYEYEFSNFTEDEKHKVVYHFFKHLEIDEIPTFIEKHKVAKLNFKGFYEKYNPTLKDLEKFVTSMFYLYGESDPVFFDATTKRYLSRIMNNYFDETIIKMYPYLNASNQAMLLDAFLIEDLWKARDVFEMGIGGFKKINLSMGLEILLTKDSNIINKFIYHLERYYHLVKENPLYVEYIVDNYEDLRKIESVTNFLVKRICKKTDKYHAFDTLIKSDKDKKKILKAKKKEYCIENGLFD